MKYFEYVKSGQYFTRIYHRLDGPANRGFYFTDFYIYGYRYMSKASVSEYKQALLLMRLLKNK